MSRTRKDTKIKHLGDEQQWLYGTENVFYEYLYTDPWGATATIHSTVRVDIAGAKVKRKRGFLRKDHYCYTKSPSWFTRMFMTSPKRVKCRKWARDVICGGELDAVCPDFGNKPDVYFH
jgi:hypothetical protein